MRTLSRRTLLRSSGALLSLPWLPQGAHAGPVTLAIVTGAKSPVTGVSRAELKRLFLGDPVSVSGQTLVPFNAPPASAERLAFEKVVLGMTAEEVTKTWVDKRIRGVAKPPKVAPEPGFLLKLAAAYPGAITYVPFAIVNATVKVVSVDGKKPGDPGYPLG